MCFCLLYTSKAIVSVYEVPDDLLDELDLLDDMPRGIGFDRRRLDVERIHRTVVTPVSYTHL